MVPVTLVAFVIALIPLAVKRRLIQDMQEKQANGT
jgi:hypothetical protein